jgi:hypothetical protein
MARLVVVGLLRGTRDLKYAMTCCHPLPSAAAEHRDSRVQNHAGKSRSIACEIGSSAAAADTPRNSLCFSAQCLSRNFVSSSVAVVSCRTHRWETQQPLRVIYRQSSDLIISAASWQAASSGGDVISASSRRFCHDKAGGRQFQPRLIWIRFPARSPALSFSQRRATRSYLSRRCLDNIESTPESAFDRQNGVPQCAPVAGR